MKESNIEKIKYFKQLSENFKKITVTSHNSPDGDAIGSATAIYQILKKINSDTHIIMPSDFAENLLYIPYAQDIIKYPENKSIAENIINTSDLIFCTDFNAVSRTEKLAEILNNSTAFKIVTDHHPDAENFTDILITDTNASSASEIVYEFILEAGLKHLIDKDIAKSLFIGIMTDTINFSVNCNNKRTFEIAAELLSYEIDRTDIYNNFYNNFALERLRFSGYLMYEKLKIYNDNKLAYIIVTDADIKKINYIDSDHEGFVNMPLSVGSVIVSVYIVEKQNFLKVSIRSKGNFDVNIFARKYFNGGGHKNASGGRLYIKPDEAELYIKNSYLSYINTLNL